VAPRPSQNTVAVTQPAYPRSSLSDGQVQHLKDEIELLEAQRNTKMAHLRAAKTVAENAARKFEILRSLDKSGQASKMDVLNAEGEVSTARSQIDVMEAEFNEFEVKLKQAKRRLGEATPARNRSAAETTSTPVLVPARSKTTNPPVSTALPDLRNIA